MIAWRIQEGATLISQANVGLPSTAYGFVIRRFAPSAGSHTCKGCPDERERGHGENWRPVDAAGMYPRPRGVAVSIARRRGTGYSSSATSEGQIVYSLLNHKAGTKP